jgi:hypothetical protein
MMEGLVTKTKPDAESFDQASPFEQQPAAYYRATANRYRHLMAEATTRRLTDTFSEMIAQCETRAREIEDSEN